MDPPYPSTQKKTHKKNPILPNPQWAVVLCLDVEQFTWLYSSVKYGDDDDDGGDDDDDDCCQ